MIGIWWFLVLALGIQIVFFIPAYVKRTDKVTDFAYGATFILIAVVALLSGQASFGKLVLFAMIAIWGLRLIKYLVARIKRMGRDKRFDEVRDKPAKFGSFFFAQGVLAWVIMIPSIWFLQSEASYFGWIGVLGTLIWGIGFYFESVADKEKFEFKSDKKNKGKWIDIGLWKYSRHPNYFGECMMWIGVYVFTLPALTQTQAFFALISPLAILVFLVFFTGIPPLEKKYDERYKNNKAYQNYKKCTSVFIPMPPRC